MCAAEYKVRWLAEADPNRRPFECDEIRTWISDSDSESGVWEEGGLGSGDRGETLLCTAPDMPHVGQVEVTVESGGWTLEGEGFRQS